MTGTSQKFLDEDFSMSFNTVRGGKMVSTGFTLETEDISYPWAAGTVLQKGAVGPCSRPAVVVSTGKNAAEQVRATGVVKEAGVSIFFFNAHLFFELTRMVHIKDRV